MKFGMFFLAEYGHIIAAPCLITTLFLGGWQLPVPDSVLAAVGLREGSIVLGLLQMGAFLTKMVCMSFFFIWVRWSLPRFRYDQLMNLGWKGMLPLALANIVVTSTVMYFFR